MFFSFVKRTVVLWRSALNKRVLLLLLLLNWWSLNVLCKNIVLSLVSPNDPRLTFAPINGIESLKLMHMYVSHGQAT